MANAAYRLFLAPAIALMVLAIAASAMAAPPACNPKVKIDDSHFAISNAMKLASSIKYGVTGLAADDSGDHPTNTLITALKNFQTAVTGFVDANKQDTDPGHYTFSSSKDCPSKPSGSLGKDGCDYCPKFAKPRIYCDQAGATYYDLVLRADAYALTYGSSSNATIKGNFDGIKINPVEGVSCLALNLVYFAPNSNKEQAASKLELALDTLLGATDGPVPVQKALWGIK